MKKNNDITIDVVNKGANPLPSFSKSGDACVDLRADFTNGFNDELGSSVVWDDVEKCVRLFPGGRCLIPTGLYTAFNENYKLEIVPRSGLTIKHGITVLNTPGTVDAKLTNITSSGHFKYSDIIHMRIK